MRGSVWYMNGEISLGRGGRWFCDGVRGWGGGYVLVGWWLKWWWRRCGIGKYLFRVFIFVYFCWVY